MITDAVLDFVGSLSGLVSSLPELGILRWTAQGLGEVGEALGIVVRSVPFVEWNLILTFLWWMVTVFYPALLAYRLALWVYHQFWGS